MRPSGWTPAKRRRRLDLSTPVRNFDFQSVHVAGAERIASVAARCGVSQLVHVSHLNASLTSPSKFYETKALGEERVKAAFPTATIIRPGTMYGFEDRFLNSIASASCDSPQSTLTNLASSLAVVVEIKSQQDPDSTSTRNTFATWRQMYC